MKVQPVFFGVVTLEAVCFAFFAEYLTSEVAENREGILSIFKAFLNLFPIFSNCRHLSSRIRSDPYCLLAIAEKQQSYSNRPLV